MKDQPCTVLALTIAFLLSCVLSIPVKDSRQMVRRQQCLEPKETQNVWLSIRLISSQSAVCASEMYYVQHCFFWIPNSILFLSRFGMARFCSPGNSICHHCSPFLCISVCTLLFLGWILWSSSAERARNIYDDIWLLNHPSIYHSL